MRTALGAGSLHEKKINVTLCHLFSYLLNAGNVKPARPSLDQVFGTIYARTVAFVTSVTSSDGLLFLNAPVSNSGSALPGMLALVLSVKD